MSPAAPVGVLPAEFVGVARSKIDDWTCGKLGDRGVPDVLDFGGPRTENDFEWCSKPQILSIESTGPVSAIRLDGHHDSTQYGVDRSTQRPRDNQFALESAVQGSGRAPGRHSRHFVAVMQRDVRPESTVFDDVWAHTP